MSVIIRLQNLPWSANALDIRNFFRGLSIPEGGVHIVGGELGDAFIAFSTDEDARQAMMLDGGKIKEIQVKLLLSSRSEMHKVIETARQTVSLLTLSTPVVPAAVHVPVTVQPQIPVVTTAPMVNPFAAALSTSTLSNFGIPGIGNPQEIPQPAVIEPPAPLISPSDNSASPKNIDMSEKEDEKFERKRSRDKDRRRTRSRSRSRDRDRKDRKRDRRDRSRSRDRRRRDRSRSRDRRDRKRDRKDRSRSHDRSPSRRSRDRRNIDRKSPLLIQNDSSQGEIPPPPPLFGSVNIINQSKQQLLPGSIPQNTIMDQNESTQNRFTDPSIAEAYNKLQELGKKRNPNAFQGEQQNGSGRNQGNLNNPARNAPNFRRDGRTSRFDNDKQSDCCVAIRNAPNHTSYGDVRRFFPFMIDKHGIKMINDSMGRRTGNIYVRFCDSRSKLLALQRKNIELKGQEVLVESLDDGEYDSAVDSFLPFREDNDGEDASLVIADDDTPEPSFSVLKLTDLPNFVKEHDIIKSFNDFSLLSIMLNDCRASRSKYAFVQFAKPEDAKAALDRKERCVFGRRHATITPVSDDEFDKEKIKNEKLSEPNVVTTTDPPQEEVKVPRDPRQRRQQFANNSTVPQPQTTVQVQAPGAPGIFPGPFGQQQPFGAAFATGSPFSGFPGHGVMDPRAAATWANRPPFPNQLNSLNQIPGGPLSNTMPVQNVPQEMDDESLDCVLMKGLPKKATDRTIVTFLSDTGAVPSRIHLMLDANGSPSGDCFCEFRSTQEARRAATKHGQNLDGCRVTVDLVTRGVVEEALEGPKQPEPRESLLGTAPPKFFEQPRGGFAGPGPRGPYRGRGFNRGGFDQGGGNFDNMRGGFDQSRGSFDQGRGGYRGRANWNERGGRGGYDRGRGRGFNRGRGGGGVSGGGTVFENGRDPRIMIEDDPALEDFGAPGCVVSMENVPFRATVDDILNFFSDFELTPDDVIRRYNERGQPTGDARVAFRSPLDAETAANSRNMNIIHDRRISLSVI